MEFGKVWTESKDEAIARLRAMGIDLRDLDGEPIPSTYTVSPAAVAAAAITHSTLLHDAIDKEDVELVRKLLRDGVEINSRNIRGETPLENAVGYYYTDIVRVLVDHGADVNAEASAGGSILDYARRISECKEIVPILERPPQPIRAKRHWWQFWQ